MRQKNFLFISLLLLAVFCASIFQSTSYGETVNYPYGLINLRLSPSEDPIIGMGNYFSALDYGTKSILWNPASLGKEKLSDTSLSYSTASGNYNILKTTNYGELSGTSELGSTTGSTTATPIRYGIFFRAPSAIGTGISTKEIQLSSSLNYSTSITGINFATAQRVNDWITVGFSSRAPIGGELDISGNFPTTAKMATNLYGQTLGNMAITSGGKMGYTFTSGGIVTTPETVSPLWSGFLSQEAVIPFTNLTEIRNNIDIQAPYIATIASQFGKFYAGLNMFPISATAQIANDIRSVVNSDAPDQFFYLPNFDPTDATAGAKWLSDPDKYGAQSGYTRKQITLPSGDVVADARYTGYYSGNTLRTDIGFMYDFSDWVTVGLALENFGSAALSMKGNGIASYINYRDFNTSGAASLLQPGQTSAWAPFLDTWTTTTEISGAKLSLEPEKTYKIPQKMRIGVAIKKPFLVAIDYEQNQTPLSLALGNNTTSTISNLNLIRLGFESQFFFMPIWIRFGTVLLTKPTIVGADAATLNTINSAFKYKVLPAKLDLGSYVNLWGYELGDAIGFDLLPIINTLQVDVNNIDLSKMAYYSFSLKKDSWTIDYLSHLDLLSSAAAYSGKPADSSGKKSLAISDIKFIQTLGISYKF
ncbi:hypothetical protein HZC34_03690 [Candidatus Saganbacteria bacterium]|nr:hypothetical protein [Candidatus Saganbacteria bacterium]